MSSLSLLIAASADIRAEEWLRTQVAAVLDHPDANLTIFGRNEALGRVLATQGVSFASVHADGKASRGELRKLLAKVDYLLLLWDGREHTKLLFEARLKGTKMKVVPFETTTVVNRDRGDEYDVYIGRGTIWGNPYPVGPLEGQHTREDAIELYRRDFLKRLETEPDFRQGLMGLRGYRLACFCKPLACHGDVIADYLNAQPQPTEVERR